MSTAGMSPVPAADPTPKAAVEVMAHLSARGLTDERLRALHHRAQTTVNSFTQYCQARASFSDDSAVNRDVVRRLLVVQRHLSELGNAPEAADWDAATRLAVEQFPIRGGPPRPEFSWIPFYTELSGKVLQFEERQADLLAILRRLSAAGLPVVGLRDRTDGGERDLDVMDPFTFFAVFNRNITPANRTAILERLKVEFGLAASVPTDYAGIPAAQNQQSWFFPYATSRGREDIPVLWALARAAHGKRPEEVPAPAFNRALAVHTIGFAKLTMGLFWLDAQNWLPCDSKTLAYLSAEGVELPSKDHAGYLALLKRVAEELGSDFPRISADAYAWDPSKAKSPKPPKPTEATKRYWAGGFGEHEKLAAFLRDAYWQVGWPRDSEKRGGRQCWEEFVKIKAGDMLAIKGLGGRNDLRVHAIGEVTAVDQNAGRVTLRWTDQTPRSLKAPRLAEKGSWFNTLVPVTGEAAIRQVFGGGASPPPPNPVIGVDTILRAFGASSYVFSPSLVRRLHAALHALDTKRFVLLTGLSGTGKTLLTRVYAHAYHAIPLDQDNDYYLVIPVRPNWNTPRDLLGYYNPIVGRYESTPFLELLLRAEADPLHAYFAVLDEMNLAPVEHYLSDVLSAMESGEPIPLWSAPSMAAPRPHEGWNEDTGPGKEVVRKDLVIWALRNLGGEGSNDDIWSRIEDHPVHAGSTPRASMRRALQELRDAGLVEQAEEASMWRLVENAEKGQAPRELILPSNVFLIGTVNVDETTHGFSDKVLDRAFTIELWEVDWDAYERAIDADLRATTAWVLPVLRDLHGVLAQQHLDFGYRTANEVLRYVRCYAGDTQDRSALDDAIKMKILPKVRGDSRVKAMLDALEATVVRHLGEKALSLGVVRRMRTELQDHGSTRFWR